GLNLIDDFRGDSFYNFLVDYRMTQINDLGAEWKNEAQIGRTRSFFTEFYQPLDYRELFFLAPRFKYERSVEDVYSGTVRTAEYRVRSSDVGIDAGINLDTYAEARIGITRGEVSAGPIVGGASLPSFEVDKAAYIGGLTFDQLDNSNFPRYGIIANVNLFSSSKDLGADESYDILDFGFMKATTHKKHTILASFTGGTSIDDDAPFYDELTLGGFLSLSGYRSDQLRGQHRGLGRLMYYYELLGLHTGFLDTIYLGGSFESGNVWDKDSDIDTGDLLFGGSIFLGADTIFGPLYVAYGRSEGSKEGQIYLFLGQTF
ncbi:BamA/TamA family outer membrane protein, partial [Candidatus Omnitrophota bacterium]